MLDSPRVVLTRGLSLSRTPQAGDAVLSDHHGAAGFHRGISIDAHANLGARDGLVRQRVRCEVGDALLRTTPVGSMPKSRVAEGSLTPPLSQVGSRTGAPV
jgi:hypothetical protein